MKNLITKGLALLSGVLCAGISNAQNGPGVVTETFQVKGNCEMCRKTIEKAASIKGVKSAQWNEHSKVLTVKYDRSKATSAEVLRKVAYAGYDNERYAAPEKAYQNLHACCQYDRESGKDTKTASHASHREMMPAAANTASQKKESGISKVYDAYFTTKDALVRTDAEAASAGAKQILDALDAVDMGAMSQKEHDAYMKSLKDLKEQAKLIATSKNIEKQRLAFSSLSKTIYGVMKSISPGYEVYFDHCPMYNDGKGAYWLSKEKGIRNPFYGSKMMTCGNVQETLK